MRASELRTWAKEIRSDEGGGGTVVLAGHLADQIATAIVAGAAELERCEDARSQLASDFPCRRCGSPDHKARDCDGAPGSIGCTGVAAVWCPIHGDCACPSDKDGERLKKNSPTCPLHAPTSRHAEAEYRMCTPREGPRGEWLPSFVRSGEESDLQSPNVWLYYGRDSVPIFCGRSHEDAERVRSVLEAVAKWVTP